MDDCEHEPKPRRIHLSDKEVLAKVREILETPVGECILCHAEHIKIGYDFWYAGPLPALPPGVWDRDVRT